MTPERLYESRRADWHHLTSLLARGEQNLKQLSPGDVQELSRLYRAATSDLALAQRDFPRHRVTVYLNGLVARAHAVLYQEEPLALRRILAFFTTLFPRTYRETFRYTLVAAVLFFGPFFLFALLNAANPEAARTILPPALEANIQQLENQELWTNIPIEERPYAASFIMTNNIQVSFLAFAGGITFGLLTIYAMLFNGLVIGGIVGLAYFYGLGGELTSFMVGHGVIELSVIVMAGGAGLMMGWALIRPGLLRRRDALVLAARKALILVGGAVPLLVIAGLIEGFISPAEMIPWPLKWVVGGITGILLYAYLFLAGRE
jgi:uncharacterized membrane protein SpoIIM required for sporulation